MTIASDTSAGLSEWPELRHQRKAIVVVDVVESVRLMQANEADVIDRWRRFVNEVRTQALPMHGGRLVKSLGDGLLLEFESVQAAVATSFDLHRRLPPFNAGRDAGASLKLRIGIHVADVIVDELDIYGSGVNLAARIASIAQPGEIAVSALVRDQIVDGLDATVEDLGHCYVKHLPEPVHLYRLSVEGPAQSASAQAASDESPLPVIAVLPFEPRADDPSQLVIGRTISDDVTGALSRVASWRVVSPLSTAHFQKRALYLPSVAGHLNAHYLVTGRFVATSDRLSLDIELVQVATGRVTWSRRYHGASSSLIAGDDAVIGEMANDIGMAVLSQELRRGLTLPPRNLESCTLLLSAVSIMHRASACEFERARQMLEYLVERHPRMPAAHTWLGKWYGLRAAQGWSTNLRQDAALATDHLNRALTINENDALAWTIAGLIRGYIRKDLEGAAEAYERALQSNPNESLAWLYLSTLHAWADRGDLAAAAADRALSLSPLDPMRYYFDSLSATAYAVAGDHPRAVAAANRSLRANLTHASTYRILTIAQALSGDVDNARKTAARLMVVQPGLTVKIFRERYPGQASVHADSFCDALAEAGVPA